VGASLYPKGKKKSLRISRIEKESKTSLTKQESPEAGWVEKEPQVFQLHGREDMEGRRESEFNGMTGEKCMKPGPAGSSGGRKVEDGKEGPRCSVTGILKLIPRT